MKILVACEESQAVTLAFRKKGHIAYSCDIKPCTGGHPEYHIIADVLEVIQGGCFLTESGEEISIDCWDLMVGHPPCTYISNAGIGYFNIKRYGIKAEQRMLDRLVAAQFFMKLYMAPIPKICIENPVGFVNSFLKPTQVIHPYFFGDPHKKRTCLWLKGLPALMHACEDTLLIEKTHVAAEPIYIDSSGKPRYFTDAISGGTKNTQTLRSKTFPGIAAAMADQWG